MRFFSNLIAKAKARIQTAPAIFLSVDFLMVILSDKQVPSCAYLFFIFNEFAYLIFYTRNNLKELSDFFQRLKAGDT
jgi:hypothetical protein